MPRRRSKKPVQQRVEGSCGHFCNEWPQLRGFVLCETCEKWIDPLPVYVMPGEVPLFELTPDMVGP
jgi:hypothetical protein